MNEVNKAGPHYDVVIVGAGMAGLYAAQRMQQMGLSVKVIEAGSDVGGTWYWNRYPDARCDVESLQYSYSFSPELEKEWVWPERYSAQPELLAYLQLVAEKFHLRRHIQFNTRVTSAVFDDVSTQWTIQTDSGNVLTANYCIMATGNLSLPTLPKFQGLERFSGETYHTGKWPHHKVKFQGKRVGVIGTGSSGIQVIPQVAKEASQLLVFQRTPNFCVPAANRPLSPEEVRAYKENYVEHRKQAMETPFCMGGFPPPTRGAMEATAQERQQTYQRGWERGGAVSFLYTYNDLLTNRESNETAAEFVRQKIREIVQDPKVAELLSPSDYPIGAKRLCVSDLYYQTYNRDNVSLVDVRNVPIVEFTETGIRTETTHYELDAVIFATGFDAITGALSRIDIRGSQGRPLTQAWEDGPRCFLGLMVAGFPNMFQITGPQSPSVKANLFCAIEQHVDWIVDCMKALQQRGVRRFEVTQAAQDQWVEHSTAVADSTLYPAAESWYLGSNVPGKPRLFAPYVGGFDKFRKKCDAVAAAGYQEFLMDGASPTNSSEVSAGLQTSGATHD